MPTWTDPQLVNELINPRRFLRGRPVVDMPTLVQKRYEQRVPGLFRSVLDARTRLHPLATVVETAESVDLHEEIVDERTLQLALCATATLPLIGGPPIQLDGKRLVDSGVSAAIPFRAALEQGATHVLLLRSRRHGHRVERPSRLSRTLTGRALRRMSPAVETAFRTRFEREHADEDLLDQHRNDPARRPWIYAIHPPADSPVPSRLDRDVGVVREAIAAGHEAALAALTGS
jgi:predicted patatin/cPLA2 family phospholipase